VQRTKETFQRRSAEVKRLQQKLEEVQKKSVKQDYAFFNLVCPRIDSLHAYLAYQEKRNNAIIAELKLELSQIKTANESVESIQSRFVAKKLGTMEVYACVRACVRARVRACVPVNACVPSLHDCR